jgi:alpha-galactosidase
MTEAFDRLQRIRPELAIEFRQEYIGPRMRRFGNMFRAGDCPNDALTNRLRTLDIRLLCGSTACHADMHMWHRDDRPESAAMQLLATLFAVPQVSVRLEGLPAEHLAMLRFWLAFWREHRDALLDGRLHPHSPHAGYPLVIASTPHKRLAAVYEDRVVNPGPRVPEQLLVVNATLGRRLVLELPEDLGERRVETRDCQGRVTSTLSARLSPGLHALAVPPAGVVRLTAAS